MPNPEKAFEEWWKDYGPGCPDAYKKAIRASFLAGHASASEENTSECDKSDYLHVHKRSLCEHGMYVAMCAGCIEALLHTQREEMVAKLEGKLSTKQPPDNWTSDQKDTWRVCQTQHNRDIDDVLALLRNQP